MAFARQLIDRRFFELAAFSLPALAACVALLAIPQRHNTYIETSTPVAKAQKPVAMVVPVPQVVEPQEVPITQPGANSNEVASPPQVPAITPMPYDGLAPMLQKPVIEPSQPHAITVQAGHSLWKIARDIYGNGRDYNVIMDANRKSIAKPELIHPGQQLVLPDKKAN